MRLLMISLLLGVVIASMGPVAAAGSQSGVPEGAMSKEELVSSFSGKTVYGKHAFKSKKGITWHSPDGKAVSRYAGEGTLKGKWWVSKKNGKFCLERGGKKRCQWVVKQSDGTYFKYKQTKQGALKHIWTYTKVVDGNAEGL